MSQNQIVFDKYKFMALLCNPPTKKHQLKVEISRKLLQGEFL